jgi:hypothetical protein
MKRSLFAFIFIFFSLINNAQCIVALDAAGNANGNASFTIQTNFPNELVMITYAGWNGPGNGPVAVDGVNATLVSIANNGNSGTTEVYAKTVAAAGVHTIVCNESGYSYAPYGINFAAGFYVSGCALTLASINVTVVNTIACDTGGSIGANMVTTAANSMIYCSSEINNGQGGNFPIAWTNANFLASLHIGNGIDAGHGYRFAAAAAAYSIVATNTSALNNGCGGLTIILAAIKPCTTCALPIELEKFECDAAGDESVNLRWTTLSEKNSSHFEIERSSDGREFVTVGKIKAAGKSESSVNYAYTDAAATKGSNYYRLKEVDKGGNSKIFDMTACDLLKIRNEVSIYPNPNDGNYTLALGASDLYQTLEVCNALNEVIYTQQFPPNPNGADHKIQLPNGQRGIFVVKVIENNKIIAVKKLVVTN